MVGPLGLAMATGPGIPSGHQHDLALIARINAGQRDAFGELYLHHRDYVLKIAWRYSRSDADALDACQNVFVYLAGKFPGFVLTCRLTTFLYPVIKHESLALRRKFQRASGIGPAGSHAPAAGDDIDEVPARDLPAGCVANPSRSLRRLQAAAASLSSGQREVVLLRFLDDLSMEEISEVLSIPIGTVKSRLHLALAKLAEHPEVQSHLAEGK